MLRLQHAQSSVACHRGADLRNLALGFYAFSPALELFSISNFNFNSPAGYSGVCSGNIYSATSSLPQLLTSKNNFFIFSCVCSI